MVPDSQWIQNLLQAEDPLTAIWEAALALWRMDTMPTDLVEFYNRREEALSLLEEMLYHGCFEVYDLLLEQAQEQDGSYVRELLQGDAVVIIADSLSLREAGLLSLWLGERGWEVEVEGFAVAPFPTVTESLSVKLLGTQPSGGRDTPEFAYRYFPGPGQLPSLPRGRPTLVWLRLPDTKLEEITVAQSTTVQDAFEITAYAIERVFEAAGNRPVSITSDHGYLYAVSSGHYWDLPEDVKGAVRKVFPRESRTQPLSKEGAKDIRHYEARTPEGRLFAISGEHIALRGRYWWGGTGPNDRCTAHGGLSLAEVMVPVLRRHFW